MSVLLGLGFEIFISFGFGFLGLEKMPRVRVGFLGSGKPDLPLFIRVLPIASTKENWLWLAEASCSVN